MTVADWPTTLPGQTITVTLTARLSTVKTRSTEAVIERHDDSWTVLDPATGIFGTGSDSASALEDFNEALHEHLDVLRRQQALSPELQAQLAYLEQRLS